MERATRRAWAATAAAASLALLLPLGALAATLELPEVLRLSAEPHFRDVTLRWETAPAPPDEADFQVRYCELQAWGANRCRTKVVGGTAGRDAQAGGRRLRAFTLHVDGLRMATNYSFEVQPLEGPGAARGPYGPYGPYGPPGLPPERALARHIVVHTLGFSARATQCLPHASEVEVRTGPYFGGRIAVEAAAGAGKGGERCALAGDPRSAREAYVLRIDHEACGARVNESTVAAFVVVQESLPLLTHSTRRFLVLCSFQPDALTVRAGINLPTQDSTYDPENDNRLEQFQSEAIPQDFIHLDTANDVQVAKLQHHRQIVDTRAEEVVQDETTAQMVLMIILVVAGIIGCIVTMWCFIPSARKSSVGPPFSGSEEQPATICENFENSLRDTLANMAADSSSCNGGLLTIERAQNPQDDGDNSTEGIFTIQTPTQVNRSRQTQFCITIESASHSEV